MTDVNTDLSNEPLPSVTDLQQNTIASPTLTADGVDYKIADVKTPNPQDDKKPFWKSKTLWLNGVSAVVLLATQYQDTAQAALTPNQYFWFGLALTAANGILRVFTTQPITK